MLKGLKKATALNGHHHQDRPESCRHWEWEGGGGEGQMGVATKIIYWSTLKENEKATHLNGYHHENRQDKSVN